MKARRTSELSAEEELRSALRAAGQRVTAQRLAIRGVLAELDRHVTAEEVSVALERRLPGVSLPTVYATLDLFEQLGIVRRLAVGGSFLYDPRPAEHQHFVCRKCGAVEDLDTRIDTRRAFAAARRRGYVAEDAGLVVTGLCDACT
jgi:Fe2+ or Zn2+ uptake regulation protein